MQYVIEVENPKDLEALQKSGIKFDVVGSEKDMFLRCCFGKADIAEYLDWRIQDNKDSQFAQYLKTDEKAYNAFIDKVFREQEEYFDANNGITNNSIDSFIDSVWKSEMKTFSKASSR